MVSPDQGFTSAEMYYKKYYHYSDMNYYQFQEDVLKRKLQNKILPPQPFVYGSDKGSSILYINSLYNKSNKMTRLKSEKSKITITVIAVVYSKLTAYRNPCFW
jgi:glycosylphosphatidylinositol transamidase (GPIT) subunit GPI8